MSAGILDTALSNLREYFSLRAAEERARSLPSERRTAIARDVRLSAQRRVAAHTLAQTGAIAEALRLVRDAQLLLVQHEDLVGKPDQAVAEVPELPLFDEECTDAHNALFERLLASQLRLQVELGALSLEPAERAMQRTSRRAAAIGLAVVVVVGLGWWARRTQLVAEASGSWSDKYPPSNAVDGDESTHWLLPDRSLGWLDVKLLPARKLRTVSVLPGYQPPTYGVIDYRLEAYAGGNVVKSVDGTFSVPSGGNKPPWVAIAIPTDVKVEKVRLVVKSYHDIGGSIAEVKIP